MNPKLIKEKEEHQKECDCNCQLNSCSHCFPAGTSENKIDKSIVVEFLEGTKIWLANMEKMGIETLCPVCGLQPKKMQELADALKNILNLK